MNIAYIMYPGACYMGKGDGQKMQAEIIGKAVMTAMNDNTSQPKLREDLISKYNVSNCVDMLVEAYRRCI